MEAPRLRWTLSRQSSAVPCSQDGVTPVWTTKMRAQIPGSRDTRGLRAKLAKYHWPKDWEGN